MSNALKAFLFPFSYRQESAIDARKQIDSTISEPKETKKAFNFLAFLFPFLYEHQKNSEEKTSSDLLQHPKLRIIDSEDGYCKKALEEMIKIQKGNEKLTKILNHKDLESLNIKYKKEAMINENLFSNPFDEKKHFEIVFSEKVPQNFYYHTFTIDDKYKCIGKKFEKDTAIFHELCHVDQQLENLSKSTKLRSSCPKKLDFNNQLEEEAIEVENQYIQEKESPPRSDHGGSILPPARDLLKDHPDNKQKELAFKNYLYKGLYDAVEISRIFSDDELIKILQSLKPNKLNIKNQVLSSLHIYPRFSFSYSEDFLKILFLIIKEKNLNINFSKSEWQGLLTVCLNNVHTLEDFKELESSGINKQIHDFSFCSKINETAKEYSKIINYIIYKQHSDMRKFFLNLRYKNYYINP